MSLPKIDLTIFPKILLIEVLSKLETSTLIKMRRTCFQIDELVEKNRSHFASRPHLGIDFDITLISGSNLRIHLNRNCLYLGGTWKNIGHTLQKKVSAISFKSIYVNGELNTQKEDGVSLVVISIFKLLQPICLDFTVKEIEQDLHLALTEEMTLVGPKGVMWYDSQAKDPQRFLANMQSARNRSKFNVLFKSATIFKDILKTFGCFSTAQLKTTISGFRELLWDIQNSKEEIKIKDIFVNIIVTPSWERSFPYTSDIVPPFRTIFHDPTIKNQPWCGCVHLLSLPSQYCLIMETDMADTSRHMDIMITFEERNLAKLSKTIKSLLVTHDEQQMSTLLADF